MSDTIMIGVAVVGVIAVFLVIRKVMHQAARDRVILAKLKQAAEDGKMDELDSETRGRMREIRDHQKRVDDAKRGHSS